MADMNSLTLNGVRYDRFKPIVDSTFTQSGKAADAKAVGDALNELEAKMDEGGSGGSTEIPFFNLAEMGLGAVTAGGSWVSLTTDTSEIRAALEEGLVKFGLKYNYEGADLYVEMTGGVLYADALDESYQIVQNGVLGDDSIMLSVTVQPGGIGAVANKLLDHDGGTGDSGTDGKDGGYYTPSVGQTSPTTVEFSFTPSDPDMPSVEPETITLPAGLKGDKGDPGEKGDRGDIGEKGDKGHPGDSADITFFDLSAMGLPAITSDGTIVSITADTSEIIAVLERGLVNFGVQLVYSGVPVDAEIVGAPMYMEATGTYQVTRILTMGVLPMFGSITISGTGISAVANVLQAALPNAEGVSF